MTLTKEQEKALIDLIGTSHAVANDKHFPEDSAKEIRHSIEVMQQFLFDCEVVFDEFEPLPRFAEQCIEQSKEVS